MIMKSLGNAMIRSNRSVMMRAPYSEVNTLKHIKSELLTNNIFLGI